MSDKRLKILFATIPQPKNRFVSDLEEGISAHADVIYDYQAFWNCDQAFDIVHIHEPEYLSYEIEACMNHTDPIPQDLWDRLITCLDYWKSRAKLVHTRHVQEPHVRTDAEFQNLYYKVFSYCDAVAHFAHFSIQQFKDFYPDLTGVVNEVIPHQNYTSLPDTVSKATARTQLKISKKAKVLLVFGMVKEREKTLIQTAFHAIPEKDKVLLAPGWKTQRRAISWIRLREWVYQWDLWKARRNSRFRTNLGFVQEADAQYYLKAADVLLIPRIDELNSGNITLGFTFGRVVMGRDGGDIGELLEATGNPTFDPKDEHSIARAVKEAFVLAEKGHGKENQHLALNEWGLDKVSTLYYQLYRQISKTAAKN